MRNPGEELQRDRLSDQLVYKTIALAIGVIGHGLYLAYKYFRHGRVNSISLGLLIFLSSFTLLMIVLILILRRIEARDGDGTWYVSRDHEHRP